LTTYFGLEPKPSVADETADPAASGD